MRASGSAMQEAGIADGDVLLVDRALQPSHGQVVVAVVDGELVCRRLWQGHFVHFFGFFNLLFVHFLKIVNPEGWILETIGANLMRVAGNLAPDTSGWGLARTFWEKATAAHVYCAQGRIRSERYARHWHDLVAIGRSSHFAAAIGDRPVAKAVAEHKSYFFIEKDAAGSVIDYFPAAAGKLQIVPEGAAREALAADYANMLADEIMVGNALPFDDLMRACAEVAARANAMAGA